jgi:pimeloyl-ACP methyl ester carboxylesterase
MNKIMKNKKKENFKIETGFFQDGLTFARIGNKSRILVVIEALSYTHEPPSGIRLKMFKRAVKSFLNDYTVYLIGRKPNVPRDYSFTDMAEDYKRMIKREFNVPVDVVGTSTGGQIALYLAANHPEVVRKLVVISAAFRLGEKGVEIERKAENFFNQKKYGKSFVALLDYLYSPGIKKKIVTIFTRLIGKKMMGKVKYPNDFLTEIRGDIEMNFKDRLKDINAPTLILSGKLDVGYKAEDVRTTANEIPDSESIIYKGYGHDLTMRNGKQVYNDLLDFLKKT